MSGIQQSFGFWNSGSSGQPTWITTSVSADTTTSATVYTTTIDSLGNYYQAGRISNNTFDATSNSDLFIIKYNKSGVIQWQVIVSGVSTGNKIEAIWGIAVDSSGNVYAAGTQSTGLFNNPDTAILLKYNINGIIQWGVTLSPVGSEYRGFLGLTISSSQELFAAGGSGSNALIVKYNTSGVIQWSKSLYSSAGYVSRFSSVVVESTSTYVYATGYTTLVGSERNIILAKYSTSDGTLQWQRQLSGLNGSVQISNDALAVTTDSSGNVYVSGKVNVSFLRDGSYLAKFDSNGNLLWQKELLNNTFSDHIDSLICDSSNNVYGFGVTSAPIGYSLVVKYDTSGNLIWQRAFGPSTTGRAISISLDSTTLYISGYGQNTAFGPQIFTLGVVIPSNGTLTGTYGGYWIYAASSVPEVAVSLTNNAGTLTSANYSPLTGGFSVTNSVWTLTQTLLPIPNVNNVIVNTVINSTAQSSAPNASSASITFNNSGTIGYIDSAISSGSANWAAPTTSGAGSSYWIKITRTGGVISSGMTSGVIYSLAMSPYIQLTTVSLGQIIVSSGIIDIYSDSGGTTRVGGGTYDINCEWYF